MDNLPKVIEDLIYDKVLQLKVNDINNQILRVVPKYKDYFCNKRSSWLYRNDCYYNRDFCYKTYIKMF